MKNDVDIFHTREGFPVDHRWDSTRNAKLLNIVFQGGTFGNFLKYFLEKFSIKTPEMNEEPFTDIGTSHTIQSANFSGMIQRYHTSFINDNEGEAGLPVCIITPSTKKHHLYLKKAQWFRASDFQISPDDLWKKALGEMPERIKNCATNIIKLYNIKETAHFSWIPKFIVRDWYKLDFLQDIEDFFDYQWFDQLKSHEFFDRQKVFYLDLETFFNWETFLKNITELDRVFGLALDFDRNEEMKALFDKGLALDVVRNECNLVESIMEQGEDKSFDNLDVSSEAFIYAELEKKYTDVQMPLTNRFFRDTQEITRYIEHFPNWYRRRNPNLGV